MTEIEERGIDAVLDDAVRIARAAPPATESRSIWTQLSRAMRRRGHAGRRRHPRSRPHRALRNFSPDRSLLALEVVEYNPDLDRGRKTAVIVEEILAAVLGAPAASARSRRNSSARLARAITTPSP